MNSEILHQPSWAESAGKKAIELYTELHGERAAVLMIGGVHGDEPEGVRLAKETLAWLQKGNSRCSWALIPCLNVDGFAKKQRTNDSGVDLNRNFPSQDWSPVVKAPRYNPGPHAASEPEVRALIQLIQKIRPWLIVHFHSWEPCVVYTGSPGKKAAQILGRGTGYEIREDIGYPTPGSLGQYGWLENKTPVICIEAQEGCDLNSVWPKFGAGLRELLSREEVPL
jgi:protein MpaA